MNTIKGILISLFLISTITLCNAQTSENKKTIISNNIEVYYFHYTRRCVTCNAVESESKSTIEKLYSEQVKKGTISFHSINLDDDKSKEIAEKLNISGQALLIVKDNKKIDLTNDGFMFARTNPKKFQEKIKKELDNLL